MRVLAPNGVAVFVNRKSEIESRKLVKPWPKEMDEWTHYLHDASNNAVARDRLVGPPKGIQWVAKPLYCRSHEIDSSVSTLVSAGGRVFYILDEGLTGITDPRLPAKWSLVARDAFNGVLLWKRPIPRWGWREWKRKRLEGKDWTTLRGQRGAFPIELHRRLVADGDKVYVTLGYAAPLSVLDAATGEVVRTFEDTEGTDEILCSGDVLVLRIRDLSADREKRRAEKAIPQLVLGLAAGTGKVLWKRQVQRMLPLSLAVAGGRVFFHNRSEIVCLDLNTGRELWRAPCKPGKVGHHTLVAHEKVVLLQGPQRLRVFSAETGRPAWTGPGGRGPGAGNPPDLFVTGGLVWWARPRPGLAQPNTQEKRQGRNATGALAMGYDLMTGELKKTVEIPNIMSPGHHFRCYRSKATERYILWPKRGVEFIDLEGDNHMRHDWLRAPCKLGVMPCNGLLYVAPHQCFCYPGVKLAGFLALSSRSGSESRGPVRERLKRGRAYSQIRNPQSALRNGEDWPTFRHDAKRSGSTKTHLSANLKRAWAADLGGRLTQPVIAGGRLFVASVDTHTVYALDAKTGKELWSFTAGGRVDSPPTIHDALVLFGCADGWVYCLRASDVALAWRFLAAPEERRVVAFGQPESGWPVHGSVLVMNGTAYFAAGRSSYLDGGIYLYGLDPKTGRKLHEGRLDGPHPDLAKDIGRPFDMEGTFSDVLVTDGSRLYMQQVMLDGNLAQQEAPRVTKMGDRKVGRHVFSTAGFLDGSGWNRTFWMYSERWPGYYIANQSPKAGQLLVFDEKATYAVKCFTRRNCHSPMFFPGKEGYLLFSDDNDNEPVLVDKEGNPKPVKWLPYDCYISSRGDTSVETPAVDKDKGVGFTRARPPRWMEWVPIRIRAMVLAGEILFVAGPPDVLDPQDPLAAFEGRKGGLLRVVSAADGRKLAEYKLETPPAWDGMAAAEGRLYISMRDGKVICLGGEG